jgi:hypothetical protein
MPLTSCTHRNRGKPSCLSQREIMKRIPTGELKGQSLLNNQQCDIRMALVASVRHFENHIRVGFIYVGN